MTTATETEAEVQTCMIIAAASAMRNHLVRDQHLSFEDRSQIDARGPHSGMEREAIGRSMFAAYSDLFGHLEINNEEYLSIMEKIEIEYSGRAYQGNGMPRNHRVVLRGKSALLLCDGSFAVASGDGEWRYLEVSEWAEWFCSQNPPRFSEWIRQWPEIDPYE